MANILDVNEILEEAKSNLDRVEVILDESNHYYVTEAYRVDGGNENGIVVLKIRHKSNY